jgi:hypothetical protein
MRGGGLRSCRGGGQRGEDDRQLQRSTARGGGKGKGEEERRREGENERGERVGGLG